VPTVANVAQYRAVSTYDGLSRDFRESTLKELPSECRAGWGVFDGYRHEGVARLELAVANSLDPWTIETAVATSAMPIFTVEKRNGGQPCFQVLGPDGSLATAINEFLAYLATCGRSAYTLRSYVTGLAHFFS
jgi:hypothetical protein